MKPMNRLPTDAKESFVNKPLCLYKSINFASEEKNFLGQIKKNVVFELPSYILGMLKDEGRGRVPSLRAFNQVERTVSPLKI